MVEKLFYALNDYTSKTLYENIQHGTEKKYSHRNVLTIYVTHRT